MADIWSLKFFEIKPEQMKFPSGRFFGSLFQIEDTSERLMVRSDQVVRSSLVRPKQKHRP